ncbi:hypothetical protein BWI17_06370 [Betaproteobacteria bacterium GR16-43]|nr:hypothetical protein BWI17_06370 [Betaproteobacteria bacterium GR16-43]
MRNPAPLLFVVILFISGSAAAADGYAGLGGGVSRADASSLEDGYASRSPAAFRTSSHSDGKDGAWKAFGGWQVHPLLALELSYSDFGEQRFGYSATEPSGSIHFRSGVTAEARRRVTGWGLDAVGRWPLGNSFSWLGSLGATRARVKLDSSGIRAAQVIGYPSTEPFRTGSAETNDWVAHVALGAEWLPAPKWALRFTYDYLGKAGSAFSTGAGEDDFRTGRSAQQSVFLAVARSF